MASKRKTTKRQTFASNLSTSNLIALAILVSILSVVLAVIVGRMLVGSMMLNARVIGKKTTASKQINANYDNLKSLQDDYSSLGGLRDTIDKALPTKPSLPELWATFENIGNSSGVSTSSVATTATADSEAPAGADVQQLPVTVAVQGDYVSIQNYLQNLELSTRPMRVTNVAIAGTNNAIQANLSITTYYQGKANLKVGSEVVQ